MNRFRWQFFLGLSLLAVSAVLYYIHFLIFHDVHHIFFYLLSDIAFLPVEVLLVTLVLHGLLTAREKRTMLNKMNMVIGAFFSEVGTVLLKELLLYDLDSDEFISAFTCRTDWTERDFLKVKEVLKDHQGNIDTKKRDLAGLRHLLVDKRDFLLRLLENPNLLEHETFTDLLWAVFHLTEELAVRRDLNKLVATDREHLSGDIKRAYILLISEWLNYMKHLKQSYPYLFSLAVRTNPFDQQARPEITSG